MKKNISLDHFLIKSDFKNLIKIMKICLLFLFAFTFQLMALNSNAQDVVIELKTSSITIGQLINEIERQTDYLVVYSNREVDTNRKVNFQQNSNKVSSYLTEAFLKTDIGYNFENDYIILSKRLQQNATDIAQMIQTPQQQGRTVTGKVVDSGGEPVIGATIVVKERPLQGTVTDIDGVFKITNLEEDAILQISYVGMRTQEITTTGLSSINVILESDMELLDEIVVVGYGQTKKKDLTGAVSVVKFDDDAMNTFSSASKALAGKAAGLQLMAISAQPGGQTSFNIRGATSVGANNEPLIVIDGFPVSSSAEPGSGNRYNGGPKDNILATLNPNDIESIVILKDASATAIYGARAGHGVILVTTKRGKEGKVKIDYSASISTQNMAKRVETLNANEWMSQYNRYHRERYLFNNRMGVYSNGGNSKPVDWSGYAGDRFSEEEILNPAHNTDWLGAVTRKGFQQQHSLTMSGGTEKTRYLTSINFFDQNGVLKNNDMQRFNSRINLDQQISEIFKAGLSLTFNQNKFSNMPLGSGEFEYAGIITTAIQSAPIRPIWDKNGNYSTNLYADYLPNAVSMLEIKDDSKLERLLSNVFLEATPIEGLHLKTTLGFDRNYNKRSTYLPKTTLYGQKTNGSAHISATERTDYLLEMTADYSKSINKHNLNGLIGYSFQDFNFNALEAGNQDFLIDGFSYNNLGAGAFSKPQVGSSAGKSQMASFFGRVNYNYNYKYYITATLRTDGASNLAKGNQWGYFPSVALAWNIAEERFFEPLYDKINQLKFRVSYGETGNSNIGNRARDFFQVGRNYLFGGVESKGVYLGQMGNKDLTWETTSEMNLGIDMILFNRLNISMEYYDRTISDLLSQRSLMSFHEVNSIAANIGKTQSKGFELTINSQNITKKDFTWKTDVTLSLYRDRWKERDSSWKPAIYERQNDYIRAQFGYKSDGLVKPEETGNIPHMPGAVAGQVKLKDIDGFQRDANGSIMFDSNGRALKTGKPDGYLDDADKVFLGSTDPGYLFGLNNTFIYKNFNLSFYLYGVADQLKWGDYHTSVDPVNFITDYGMPSSIKDFWSSENPNSKYFGMFQSQSSFGTGDYLIRKVWFMRMRNITLGYTIPLKNNKVVQWANIYIDVNNPFILTNYKGLDPETDSWAGGIYAYPNVRTYSLGVNLTF